MDLSRRSFSFATQMNLKHLVSASSWVQWRCELALALLVAGSRLWVFSYAGSPLPYYDQWLAEFNNTFLLIVGGHPPLSILFARHNEHIIFTTKIPMLLGFAANGYWDVEFLAVLAAFVRALAAALTFRLLSRETSRSAKWIIWAGCVAAFAIPFSGYNVLCGLQISFYFADLCLLASLFTVLNWRPGGKGGGLLVMWSVLGLLSMGSGICIPVATAVAHVTSSRRRTGFWPAWIVTALLIPTYAWMATRTQTDPVPLPPLVDRLGFFLELYSWPLSHHIAGIVVIVFGIVLTVSLRRAGMLHAPPFPAILGFGAFATANVLLIALRRPPEDFHMRHWEVVALVPLCFLAFASAAYFSAGAARRWLPWVVLPISAVYLAFGALLLAQHSLPYIRSAHARRDQALVSYRELLLSSRLPEMRGRMNARLAAQDYSFFDHPVGRFALHPAAVHNILIDPPAALSLLAPEVLSVRSPSVFSRLTRVVRDSGWLFCLAGFGLTVAEILGARRRSVLPVTAPANRR